MIKFFVETNGKKILDTYNEDNPTMQEVALVIYRLEELKLELLSKDFESEFEASEI